MEKVKGHWDDIQRDTTQGENPRDNKLSSSNSCVINAEDRVDLLENVLCSDLDINNPSIWTQNDGVTH